jgi:hypothetical protein
VQDSNKKGMIYTSENDFFETRHRKALVLVWEGYSLGTDIDIYLHFLYVSRILWRPKTGVEINVRVFLPVVLSRNLWSFWGLRRVYPRGNGHGIPWILWSLATIWTQCWQENNSKPVTVTTIPCPYWLRKKTFHFRNLSKAVLLISIIFLLTY